MNELCVWTSLVDMVENFLNNRRIEKLLKSLPDIGANIGIKIHFLYRHLNKFLGNCDDLRDKQGERFH